MPIINVLPKPQNLDIMFSCEDTQVKHTEEDILVLPETRPVPEALKINFQCIYLNSTFTCWSLRFTWMTAEYRLGAVLYYTCTRVQQQSVFFLKARSSNSSLQNSSNGTT